jgi:hypothetical protein
MRVPWQQLRFRFGALLLPTQHCATSQQENGMDCPIEQPVEVDFVLEVAG